MLVPTRRHCSIEHEIALALTVQKLLARLMFKKLVAFQGQGHRKEHVGTLGKALPLEIFM